jgi:hypothetical protein
MPIYSTPRDIAVALARNRRGIPFTPIQAFGLALNESLSEACLLLGSGSAAGVGPTLPPHLNPETAHG